MRKESWMGRVLVLAFAFCVFLGHPTTKAMGDKESVPPREDEITYAEAVTDHPQLKKMVDEDGFNGLSGKEQWELIGMVDRYAFFRKEAEYFAGDRGSQSTSMIYSQKAKSLRKEIKKRFGHVLKK
jgi:hypothetical protein